MVMRRGRQKVIHTWYGGCIKEAIEAGINHRVAGQIKANDREKQMWKEYVSEDIMRAEMGLFEGAI